MIDVPPQTLLKQVAAVLAPVRSAKGKASLLQDVADASTDKLQVRMMLLRSPLTAKLPHQSARQRLLARCQGC